MSTPSGPPGDGYDQGGLRPERDRTSLIDLPLPDLPLPDVLLPDVGARHGSLLRWRGMAAICFALLAFFWPRLTVFELTILWGGYSLVDGILALTAAIAGKSGTPRAWLVLMGMAGIACASTNA